MSKLKSILTKFEKLLLFQVLEQEFSQSQGDLQNRKYYIKFIDDKYQKNWAVCLCHEPHIQYEAKHWYKFAIGNDTFERYNVIFLQGLSQDKLNKIVKLTFSCNKERDHYFDMIVYVLSKAASDEEFNEYQIKL